MFAPFHTFSGCRELERHITRLRSAGTLPTRVAEAHDLYHYSLLHKLRSARYHVENVKEYLQASDAALTPPADIIYRVNFHFDGFLHVLGSGADIFAREMLTYFGIALPDNVYFHTADQLIRSARPLDPILPFIAVPSWRQEFGDYRNTATHESVIGTQYTVRIEMKGGTQLQRLEFPVPDDPRAMPRSYTRNRDIVEYCRLSYCRWLRLFNQAYSHVAQRLRAGAALPL